MQRNEAISYLKTQAPKEYKALEEAISADILATEICKALRHTIESLGEEPNFQERTIQRLVKSIREGEKTLEDYTA